jgi:aspartyl protease family protein
MMSAKPVLLVIGIGITLGLLMPSGKEGAEIPPMTNEAAAEKLAVARATDESLDTVLNRQANGHFYADVMVNDRVVNFVVDTGATTIALSEEDARRIGIPFSPADFTVVGQGASGPVQGKMITLHHVALGQKEVWDVDAVVIAGAHFSLLGQNFLGQIGSVNISGDKMTLR